MGPGSPSVKTAQTYEATGSVRAGGDGQHEPPHRVELLHRNLEKFGTITNTLGLACDVSGEVVAEAPSVKQA